MIAEVIVPRPVFQRYHYRVPKEWEPFVLSGSRVRIPFGRSEAIGLVAQTLSETREIEANRLKSIGGPLEGFAILDAKGFEFLGAIASHWVLSEGEAASLLLPRYQPTLSVRYRLCEDFQTRLSSLNPRRHGFHRVLVDLFAFRDQLMTQEELQARSGASKSMLQELKRDGWVVTQPDLPALKPSSFIGDVDTQAFAKLSEQQLKAFGTLKEAQGEAYLYGVTGAGKTEVYLHLALQEIQAGGAVLFLVPEIALTPQMEKVFSQRFGSRVAVLHSGVSEKQRYEIYTGCLRGEVQIVVGARSALFAPLSRLSLILIDEEGEGSYKQDTQPVYDARIAAGFLARIRGARLIQGSATPSLQAWSSIRNQTLVTARMPDRHSKQTPPHVELVNMREEFSRQNKSVFSRYLQSRLKQELSKGNQAILLVNRRGHSSFVMCRSCAHIVECEACSVSMTYHETSRQLHCHYCTRTSPVPRECPSCGVQAIKFFGLGTQRAETEFARLFAGIRHVRIDTDTARKGDFLRNTLKSMAAKEVQVLIGTQMVAKGLDFEDVTLVGILNADSSVSMPDYAASERALQLFAQVAGRAGRAAKKGEVILQTYQPEHRVYEALRNQGFEAFWDQELLEREEAGFPPSRHLIKVLCTAVSQNKAQEGCEKAHKAICALLKDMEEAQISPAQSSPVERLEGRFRYRIVIKSYPSKRVWDGLQAFRRTFRALNQTRVKLIVDSDNLF